MSAWFLLARAFVGTPTPSEMVIDSSGPLIPVHLFGMLIGLAQGYTPLKILGFSSVVFGQLLVGAIVGGIVARNARPVRLLGIATAVLLVATLAAFATALQTSYLGFPEGAARAATIAVLVSGYALFFVVTRWALGVAGRENIDAGRRRFLVGGTSLIAALIGGGAWTALFARSSFSYDGTIYRGPDVQALTPVSRFYVVTKNVIDPNPERGAWRLRVAGPGLRARAYAYPELTALPFVEQETTLMCINNPVDGGLMSNALWRGIPLRALIRDHVDPSIRRVALHAADNYIDTISIAKALDPTTIVAYTMNGEPLPDRHGFPVRAIVPGLFGEKNVKWLTGITLETTELKGFYERQGWGPTFTIPTHSRFDAPDLTKPLPRGEQDLRGVAFAGDRGVSRVEVTTDGGASWHDASFVTPYNRLSWRLWTFRWTPDGPGAYHLSVRATDGNGNVQTEQRRGAETEGVTGRDDVIAHVV